MKPIFILLTIFLGIFFTACQKSETSTKPASENIYPQQQNHPYHFSGSIPQNIIFQKAIGTTSDQSLYLEVQVIGTLISPCYQPEEKKFLCASGSGAIQGIIRIHNSNPYCGLPMGDYSLRPLQPSLIYSAVLHYGIYEANGPSGAKFQLELSGRGAIFYNPNSLNSLDPNNRIGLNAILRLSNGATCGAIATY